MILRRSRHVQILPLLCAVCGLTLAFPTQTPSSREEVQHLQVNIPHSGPILAPLGSSVSIPCLVSLSSTPASSSSSPVIPRVKWTVVSGGVETQILVARGQRVKINEVYRDRAALLNYTSAPDDVSLWLGDLLHRDSGHYRCEVQQGLEDASDIIQVKVKGVVFHYRDALGRYAFSFQQAQQACRSIGAQIATPDQLLAAYYDGYEQCDAGWLADQSVRYPIQVPREGCYGDMDGQPGVRNYGTMDPDDLFDVYCYVEQINGEVFHDSISQQLSFDEAQQYCRTSGAELATTAQLYFAWSQGLDRCSPGWLADGSVRYPITSPRERCGGAQSGVKTLYRFSNQTGFPEPNSLHDVYCFRETGKTSSSSQMDYLTTEAGDIEQNVIILSQTDQEIQLNQLLEQVEREAQSVLESLSILPRQFTTENPDDTHPTVTSDSAETSPSTTSATDSLQLFNETSGMSHDSNHPTEVMNTTISKTETYNSTQNTPFPPSVYNETHLHQNWSFTFQQSQFERTTHKPHTENQTASDTKETTYPYEKLKLSPKIHQAISNYDNVHANYSETDRNDTQEEGFWEATTLTVDPLLQVKLEEATLEDPELSTQASQENETLPTQVTQTTESATKTLTSLWGHMDGSGDISQERDREVKEFTISHFSTTGFTTHPSRPALASGAPTEPQTVAPDPTDSLEPLSVVKLGSEVFSTTPYLWESSISGQEGSTSLETGDMLTTEGEEMQIHTTQPVEWVVSEESLTTTESPEGLNTSQSPSEFAATQNQTSTYKLFFDSSSSYEEGSGHEPGTVSSNSQDNNKFASTFEKQTIASPVHEEETNDSLSVGKGKVAPTHILKEEGKVITTLVLKEEASVTPTIEKGTIVAPTLVLETGSKVDQTLVFEEEDKVTPTFVFTEAAKGVLTVDEQTKVPLVLDLEEKTSVAPTIEIDGKVAPTPVQKKTTEVTPTLILEEEAKSVPTLVLEEEAKITPTFVLAETAKVVPTLEEETKVSSSLDLEEETSVARTTEIEAKVAPTVGFKEDTKVAPTFIFEEEAKVAPTLVLPESAKVAPTLEEETKVPSSLDLEEETSVARTTEIEGKDAPTVGFKEDTKVAPTFIIEEEAKVAPTLVLPEAAKVAPTLEEDTKVPSTPDLDEETSVAWTTEIEGKVFPTLVLKEDTKVAPTFIIEEEAKAAPTLVLEEVKITSTLVLPETAKVGPTLEEETQVPPSLDLEEEEASAALTIEVESKVAPTLVIEEYTKVSPTLVLEEEAKAAPTLVIKEEAGVPSTFDPEEEASVSLTLEEEAKISPTLVHEKDMVAPALVTERVRVAPTFDLEEETNFAPTLDKFTNAPLNSQTSMWALLTTTSRPKDSLNDVKFNQRPPFKAVLDSQTSQMSTKPSSAASKTVPPSITTTMQKSRYTWSQTTTTPKSFHEKVELQKVTHVIPPVDHGLVDLELSLTQPPTLLILPNERAAVGGTGKSSDACLDDPCLNGGTCTERDGQIKCFCLPTYGGDLCETDLEQCELGWDKFHGFCYRHYSQRQSWEVAEQHCRKQGAHLVSIMTPKEQDYINSNYKEYQWTGLNDKTIEDDFRWSDGNPLLYENWYRGQPDSYFLSGEDCVVMVWHDQGRWSDVPCNYHLAYTCKKGTSSCGPPPKIRNASIFGRVRQRYETNAMVRYHCKEGFQQRLNPVIKCLSGGHWQRPEILCISRAGESMQLPDESSVTDINFAAAENEFEATEKTPPFWDIKFS